MTLTPTILWLCAGLLGHQEADPANCAPSGRPQPEARVETRRGVPVLTVDGVPYGPMMFVQHGDSSPDYIRKLYEGGTRLFVLIYHVDYPAFDALDRRVEALRKQAPDAYILVRTVNWLPPGWGQAHRDELLDVADGKPLNDNYYTFASPSWQAAVREMLTALVHHVRASAYSDRVIGYIVGQGATDESGYFLWGVDHSPAMLKYFRKWAGKKYGHRVEALRRSWNDPRVTFDNLTVPSREEEHTPGFGAFRDPRTAQKVVDYYVAHNEAVCDALLGYAKTIKAASGGKSIVGFLYGTLNTTHYVYSGTSLAEKLIRAPEIDFLGTPMPYENRGLGDDTPYRHAIGSFMLHNKLYLNEADTRTYRNRPEQVQHGRPGTLAGSIEYLKRDFGRTFVRQVTGYWFGGHRHFGDEHFLPLFSKFQAISARGLKTDNRLREGIAVIVDQESLFYADQPTTWNLLNTEPIQEFGRFGTNWDVYYLSDLAADRMPDYKMVLFLNPFVMDAEKLRRVSRTLKRDGKVLVWMYAAGLINVDADPPIGPSNMHQLTGMRFGVEMNGLPCDMEITNVTHEITRGLAAEYKLGSFVRPTTTGFGVVGPEFKPVLPEPLGINPLFYVDDPDAEVLARFRVNRRPSFAVKRFPDWTSVYYGSMALPAEMIRRLARFAGVHIFLETEDILHVNNHFLMIHTSPRAGAREVFLPRTVGKVVELFSNKQVAEHADTFRVVLKPLSTYLYDWGD